MIRFVYFDVGGVVIDDFSGNGKWYDLMAELGVPLTEEEAFKQVWGRYAHDMCTTRDIETLVPVLKQEFGLTLPDDYLLLAAFVQRFEANPLVWPLVRKVKQKAKIGLLTNMYPGMLAAIERRGILPDVAWDTVVDSSVEFLQKPDRQLFARAQEKAGVPGSEILFIDNSAEHVEAASAFGWQAYLYDSSNHEAAVHDLERFLRERELV